MSDKIDISPGDLPPWLRDFASSSADAELAEMALKAADRIDVLAARLAEMEQERDAARDGVMDNHIRHTNAEKRAERAEALLAQAVEAGRIALDQDAGETDRRLAMKDLRTILALIDQPTPIAREGFATSGAEARWIEDTEAGVYDSQPAPASHPVRVKPLEWRESETTTGYWEGEGDLCGTYVAYDYPNAGPLWFNRRKEGRHYCESVDAAKAAAQADYEARIMAALEPASAVTDDWRDVLMQADTGEKTMFDWSTGSGDPEGEFARIGLRQETPDGQTLYRTYRAIGPWGEPAPMLEPAPAMTVEEAARVLLRLDEYGNRKAVYDACANRVKVYKFDAVLRALAGEGKP